MLSGYAYHFTDEKTDVQISEDLPRITQLVAGKARNPAGLLPCTLSAAQGACPEL